MPQLSNNSFILTWSCVCVHVCMYAYIKRNFFTLCSECNKHDARNACDIEYWRKVNVVNELYYAVKVFRQWLERRFLERGAEMKTGMKRIRKSYRGRNVFFLRSQTSLTGQSPVKTNLDDPQHWQLPAYERCHSVWWYLRFLRGPAGVKHDFRQGGGICYEMSFYMTNQGD